MKLIELVVAAFLVVCVNAHTKVTNVTTNGVTTASCLRPRFEGYISSIDFGNQNPIMQNKAPYEDGVGTTNYTCGFLPWAGRAAASKCPVAAGSTMAVQYYHGANYGSETVELDSWIAYSHKGPIMVFMAKYDGVGGLPTGNAWFKIWQSGKLKNATNNDYNTAEYASPNMLNNNNGKIYFKIPSSIAPGNYLVRTEIIALHSAGAKYGAQPYVQCMEVTVTGSGNAQPSGVSIPGTWAYDHPIMKYNLYSVNNGPMDNILPGPAPYTDPVSASTTARQTTAVRTTGTTTARTTAAQTTVRTTGTTTARTTSAQTTVRTTGTTTAGTTGTTTARTTGSQTVRTTDATTGVVDEANNLISSSMLLLPSLFIISATLFLFF